MPFRKPLLGGFGCADGIWVGSGVSEVQEPFVTTVAGNRSGHSVRYAESR